MQDWYHAQHYGFVYLEDKSAFFLNNKIVHADARTEIIDYFVSMIPKIMQEVNNALGT